MTTAHTDPLQPPPPVGHSPGGEEAHFASTRGELLLWTGVLGPAVFVKTVPAFRGPSPSIHDTMNCDSRSVMTFSLANRL